MLKTVDDIIGELESKRTGEHLHVNLELKETWRQEHGDKISALANKINQPTTFLVVGVADDGTIKGRPESWAKQTEEVLSQHVNLRLDPVQACKSISCRKTSGGWVVVVTIQNAGEVTYRGDHPYCASGTTTKQMEPAEILKLRIQLPGLIDYISKHIMVPLTTRTW